VNDDDFPAFGHLASSGGNTNNLLLLEQQLPIASAIAVAIAFASAFAFAFAFAPTLASTPIGCYSLPGRKVKEFSNGGI
jgi:hypothetical protein